MAITNHRIVTGTAGGALGITNVGTGANVTWSGAVTTYPTLAATGLYYAWADDTSLISLAASNAARGTYYAWGTQGDDAQPPWATSPGYYELAVGTINQVVEFMTLTALNALTSGNQDALEVTFGLGLALGSTFAAGTTPAISSGSVINQTIDTGGTAATGYQLNVTTRNAQEFAPAWGVDISDLADGTETHSSTIVGKSTSHPTDMLPYGGFAKIRIHWDHSSATNTADGTVMIFVNDVLMHKSVSAKIFVTTKAYLARLCGIGSGYSSAIGGTKLRYCGPIMVRTVPPADIQADLSPPWSIQRTREHDLQRWYAATFANSGSTTYGAPWDVSGTATLAVVGTPYSSSGVQPGRSRFVVAGTSSQTFSYTLTKNVWGGDAEDDPRGSDGRVWYSFTDLYHANNCDITVVVSAELSTLHTVQLKSSTNTLVVDGVTLGTGLDTSTRFQLLLGIKEGSTCVVLYDITSTNFHAESLRVYNVANTWTGQSLDTVSIGGTFSGSVSAQVGAFGVYRSLRALFVDSYVEAEAGALTPAYHGLGSNSGAMFGCGQDITVPGCYDPIPYSGGGFTGMSIGILFARSGNRLSQFDTYMRSEALKIPGLHGILFCGVVNDVTQANASLDAAEAEALTIAARMANWIRLCANSGGSAIVVDGPNVESGTMSGSWTKYAMMEPGMVADEMAKLIPTLGVRNGSVSHCRIRGMYHTADGIMSADGIHPSGSTAWGVQRLVLLMHKSRAFAAAGAGTNADGSVTRQTTGTSGAIVAPFVGQSA